MKRALIAAGLALIGTHAGAADPGLGVSIQSSDSWIYVPIDIAEKVRIEPSLRYIDNDSESRTEDTIFGTPISTEVNSDGHTYELAVGVFGLAKLGDSVSMYYGARVAYIDSESTLRIRQRIGSSVDVIEEKATSDGYRLSPTLGFEYALTKRFSIGGEAEWFYQDLDSERTETDMNPSRAKSSGTGTDTRVILRYRF